MLAYSRKPLEIKEIIKSISNAIYIVCKNWHPNNIYIYLKNDPRPGHICVKTGSEILTSG